MTLYTWCSACGYNIEAPEQILSETFQWKTCCKSSQWNTRHSRWENNASRFITAVIMNPVCGFYQTHRTALQLTSKPYPSEERRVYSPLRISRLWPEVDSPAIWLPVSLAIAYSRKQRAPIPVDSSYRRAACWKFKPRRFYFATEYRCSQPVSRSDEAQRRRGWVLLRQTEASAAYWAAEEWCAARNGEAAIAVTCALVKPKTGQPTAVSSHHSLPRCHLRARYPLNVSSAGACLYVTTRRVLSMRGTLLCHGCISRSILQH